jgi:hypothetical protein
MFTAPTLVMPVDRSKLADDSWNSSTTSCEKFIDVLPSMELRTLPPSTVIAVLLESPPRIETENSELYCEVDPGFAVTPGSRNASCRKLRPFSGSSWIFCRVITPVTAWASVSTWMAAAATVTVSLACPISIRTSMVATLPVATVTSIVRVRKPGSSAVTT